jgi:hypothetical protein
MLHRRAHTFIRRHVHSYHAAAVNIPMNVKVSYFTSARGTGRKVFAVQRLRQLSGVHLRRVRRCQNRQVMTRLGPLLCSAIPPAQMAQYSRPKTTRSHRKYPFPPLGCSRPQLLKRHQV